MAQRIPIVLWQNILKLTASFKVHIVSIDSTGMSRPLPSSHTTTGELISNTHRNTSKTEHGY